MGVSEVAFDVSESLLLEYTAVLEIKYDHEKGRNDTSKSIISVCHSDEAQGADTPLYISAKVS